MCMVVARILELGNSQIDKSRAQGTHSRWALDLSVTAFARFVKSFDKSRNILRSAIICKYFNVRAYALPKKALLLTLIWVSLPR